MTEGQLRYQTLMENQRHNLEMEKLGAGELSVKERAQAVKEAEEKRAKSKFVLDTIERPMDFISKGVDLFGSAAKAAKDFVGSFGALFK